LTTRQSDVVRFWAGAIGSGKIKILTLQIRRSIHREPPRSRCIAASAGMGIRWMEIDITKAHGAEPSKIQNGGK
jgi:hypothetical protein